MNYFFGILIEYYKKEKNKAKIFLILAIIANLSLIGFFKYFNFIVENINFLLEFVNIAGLEVSRIHLPIGISFFTFQAMSYIIDVFRRKTVAQKNIFNVALYIALFPQLIAGPIVRYHDIAKQINNRFTDLDSFALGIKRFIFGLGKKVLIANLMGSVVDKIFAIPGSEITLSLAWLGIICYTIQIFFDFSGYSDMAIGLGKMFGFHFLENFNYPYISRSIREFWKRWHISLSNWFKDYLYIPLGGNRCKPSRVYFNLILVFFLCGLWHGATWNFVIWGLFHGVFLAIERTRFGRFLDNINIIFQHLYTMLVVIIGWVLFRADNLSQAIIFLKAMIGLGTGTGITYYASFYINIEVIITLIIGLIGFTPIVPFISRYLSTSSINKKVNIKSKSKRKIISSIIAIISIIILIAILIYSAMQLASGTYNPFIYFRF